MRRLLLSLALYSSFASYPSAAIAGDEPAPTTAPPEVIDQAPEVWALIDSRAETTFRIGQITVLSGLGAGLAGAMTGIDPLSRLGSTAFAVGTCMEAGASLRQATSIRRRGVPVSPLGGSAAWGLYVGSLVLGVAALDSAKEVTDSNGHSYAEPTTVSLGFGIGALVAHIGSLVASGAQMKTNRRARLELAKRAAADQ